MTMPAFNEPHAPGQGQDAEAPRLLPKDVVGHLLLIWAIDYIKNSPTKYAAPGKEEPVVIVDVVDLCHSPEVWRKQWWRPLYLVGALKENVGSPGPVLAVMKLGQATKGNPPFELESMSQNPQAVDLARRWYQANPGFAPSIPEPPQQQGNGQGWTDPWAGMPAAQQQRPQAPVQQQPSPGTSWAQVPTSAGPGRQWTPPAQAATSAPPAQQPLSQQSILDKLRQQAGDQHPAPPGGTVLWGSEAPPLPPPDQGEAPF